MTTTPNAHSTTRLPNCSVRSKSLELSQYKLQNKPTALYYVHGLNSTGADKSKVLREVFDSVFVPMYPNENIIEWLTSEIIKLETKYSVVLVGSSFGGFLASVLSELMNLPVVLLNPLTNPEMLRALRCPEHKLLVKYLNLPIAASPKLVLLNRDDEVLDYKDALCKYTQCGDVRVFDTGGHRMTNLHKHTEIIKRFTEELF